MTRRMERAVGRLKAGGRRVTVQRKAVLQAMAELGCARRAEEIHRRARRIHPGLGIVTVYRTLEAFAREGLAEPVFLDDGRTRFELTEDGRHHHHLVCVSCGDVQRIDECVMPALAGAAGRRGFAVTAHRLELFGLCADCQETGFRRRAHRRAAGH